MRCNVALEQNTKKGKRGWVHNLTKNKVDNVLIYNKNTTRYIYLDAQILCNWWVNDCDKYELIYNQPSISAGNVWTSSFSKVPIIDLSRCIISSGEIND
jgi:hypothetical protein